MRSLAVVNLFSFEKWVPHTTLTPKIFVNKQGASSTPEFFGNKDSFVLTFFATNTI